MTRGTRPYTTATAADTGPRAASGTGLRTASGTAPVRVTDRCAGCGACLLTCPQRAIRPVGGTLLVRAESCDGCGECVEICPVDAIDEVEVPGTGGLGTGALDTDAPDTDALLDTDVGPADVFEAARAAGGASRTDGAFGAGSGRSSDRPSGGPR